MSWLPGVNVDKCDVKYVDYGNSELVAMEALQELQPKHCVLPEQALCCTLISACPPANGWSGEVCQFQSYDLLLLVCVQVLQQFVDMVTNATLLLTVIGIYSVCDVVCLLVLMFPNAQRHTCMHMYAHIHTTHKHTYTHTYTRMHVVATVLL